ncbi:MAG TPA: hypothetical protein VMS86_13350 [Thermoanaerobaculia bacterium]|nr:hypothetical protein [Thermoanaerobaculia bacterium]
MWSGETQRGGAKVGTIIWLLLFVALVVVSKEAIPVKIRTSQLEDFMIELAKFSTREAEDRLQKRIMDKARELDLPLRKEDVSVRKSNNRVRMKAQYEVTLQFPFYTYVWHFNHDVDRPIFII